MSTPDMNMQNAASRQQPGHDSSMALLRQSTALSIRTPQNDTVLETLSSTSPVSAMFEMSFKENGSEAGAAVGHSDTSVQTVALENRAVDDYHAMDSQTFDFTLPQGGAQRPAIDEPDDDSPLSRQKYPTVSPQVDHRVNSAATDVQEGNGRALPTQTLRRHPSSIDPPMIEKDTRQLDPGWRPKFLRRRVLLPAAVFLALMLICLELLLVYSKNHNGISGANSHYRYLWIYGPSAIFTLFSIAWYQVEYDAKMMQPWIEMARGPATAERSLLLDYINPLEPVPLFKALRARHPLVASSIGTKYMLQLATVLSTGILVLESVSASRETKVCVTSFFGTNGELSVLPYAITSYEGAEAFARQVYNFTPNSDAETTFQNRRVIQAFHAVERPEKDEWNISSIVNCFMSEIHCENADPIIQPLNLGISCNYSIGVNPRFYLNQNWANVTDSTCSVDGLSLNTPCLDESQRAIQPLETYVLDANYQGCKSGTDINQTRIFFSIGGNVRSSAMADPNIHSRLVQCKPTYLLQNATVTRDQTGKVLAVDPLKPDTHVLPGLISDGDLGSNVVYAYGNSEGIPFFDTDKSVFQVGHPIFYAPLTLNRSLLERFYDEDSGFIDAIKDTYTVGAAALMSTHFMIRHGVNESCTKFANGTISWLEERLVVNALPTYIIEGLLGCALVLTVLALFFIPSSVVSSPPDSLCFAAAVVRRSADIEALLQHAALLVPRAFQGLLGQHTYRTRRLMGSGLEIELGNAAEVKEAEMMPLQGKEWYSPHWFKHYGKILLIAFPVGLICALGALLHVSHVGPGICNVKDIRSDRYAWLIIRNASADEKSRSYPSSSATVFGYKAWRIAIIAACLVGVVAPFLTIFSAGLYTTSETYNATSLVKVQHIDWFNASAIASAKRLDNDPPLVAGLLAFSNMSFPAGTYDTFAFPSLEITSSVSDGRLQYSIPAYRARVRCYTVQRYNVTVVKGFLATDPECLDCQSYTDVYVQFNFTTTDQFTDPWQTSWSRTSLNADRHHVPIDNGTVAFVELRNEAILDEPFGEFYIAAMQLEPGRIPKNLNVQVCRTAHEVLEVDVMLQYPSLDVISAVANERSARWFANGVDLYPGYLDITQAQALNRSQGLDDLFNAIVYSRWSVPFNDLITNSTLLSRTVERFIQIEAAQIANRDYRANANDLRDEGVQNVPSSFSTTMYANANRLVQSSIPTRILDGLLALLLACALVLYRKVRYQGVIPRQPGSLATTFSLVAGHSLDISPGMESWNAKEMTARQLWKG